MPFLAEKSSTDAGQKAQNSQQKLMGEPVGGKLTVRRRSSTDVLRLAIGFLR